MTESVGRFFVYGFTESADKDLPRIIELGSHAPEVLSVQEYNLEYQLYVCGL